MKIIFVFPSLDPEEDIIKLLDDLYHASGNTAEILVVDDGSKAEKQVIFETLAKRDYCTVLHHPCNLGKGAGLKTAFKYCIEKYGDDLCGCVTADGDGQHLVKDILRGAEALQAKPDVMFLGCRVFHLEHVPWKSRFGNNMTKFMFGTVLRLPISDTQTGLRAIPATFMKDCLNIRGNRFEFETEMLLLARHNHVKIEEYAIETVYFDANSGTHFHPIRDAIKIYGVIFRYVFFSLAELFRYLASALSSYLIDFGMFNLIYYVFLKNDLLVTLPHLGERNIRLFASCFLARSVSSVYNYTVNRYFVFRKNKTERAPVVKSVLEYYGLCLLILTASWLLTSLVSRFTQNTYIALCKLTVDCALFFFCYMVERIFIFKTSGKH